MKRTSFIVVEDEQRVCDQYKILVKKFENLYLIDTTKRISAALELVKRYQPNVVILDVELHGGEGNGVTFLMELAKADIKKKPFVLVVTNILSAPIHNSLRGLGADLIFTKNQEDYSIEMVLGFLSSMHEINSLEKQADEENPHMERQQYQKSLRSAISTELDLIGIGNKLKGRRYLQTAIEIVCENPQPKVSEIVGKQYGVSTPSVERAMQTAINHAWRDTDIETLERHYSTYVKPAKGVPTVTEFIYYYAKKIKDYL